jgi:GT2 family glycosyltransferase/glycosyltransferase involved in cell wall biosynthesis
MHSLLRFLRQLPFALLSPFLAGASLLGLWLTDVLWMLFGRRRLTPETRPSSAAASVLIPNWNGRDLLEKYVPSILAAIAANPANELVVVDNGSTDGSVEFLSARFPKVRVIALPENLGFGGGSNRGFREARNDIVVLLNSDMRVAPDFLQPLLDGFTDEKVFAVACQIFFSDPEKLREETGLTQGWWEQGALRVRHRIDEDITDLYPSFYGGGGSCAFDRRKVLELGAFDAILSPFYLEDTDLGYMAWKRGWKVLYQPKSRVWHEHRGTIGKKFSNAYIESAIKKNFLLWSWKNIHEPGRLAGHFVQAWAGALLSLFAGDSPERSSVAAMARAALQLPGACAARWRARSLAAVDDTEAFRRPMGGYFRDLFGSFEASRERLRVLFVSPYPICPPVHGGAVFMSQTLRQLGTLAEVHLIALLDEAWQRQAHDELRPYLASMEFMVRLEGQPKYAGAISPYAVREFWNRDLEWLIHRQILTRQIDVLQLEYTNMGQYAGEYRRLAVCLFEHDVYFQSIGRGLSTQFGTLSRIKAMVEYLRAFRYEIRLLPRMDRVQTCSRENEQYLLEFLPELKSRIDNGVRAGIDTSRYDFRTAGREPFTLLFLGSFRHLPNHAALDWFLHQVMPRILAREPRARLKVVGADPPQAHAFPLYEGAVELVGYVEDVRDALYRYSVFVCPILSGSGVRVKLLEAFAAGMPVVSTTIGAEGLGNGARPVCRLADDPDGFAAQVIELLQDTAAAGALAQAARAYVCEQRDMTKITRELERTYRSALSAKARNSSSL